MATFEQSGENPFSIPRTTFTIGETENGYTLQQSVDYGEKGAGASWADCTEEPISANVQLNVCGGTKGLWFRLKDNVGKFKYSY